MGKKAGIRELKTHTVSEVREERAEYVIASQGNPVAILHAFNEQDAESVRRRESEQALVEMKNLATEIGNAWKLPKSALEILDEDRG